RCPERRRTELYTGPRPGQSRTLLSGGPQPSYGSHSASHGCRLVIITSRRMALPSDPRPPTQRSSHWVLASVTQLSVQRRLLCRQSGGLYVVDVHQRFNDIQVPLCLTGLNIDDFAS